MRPACVFVGARMCGCATFSWQNVSAGAYWALCARTLSLHKCMYASVSVPGACMRLVGACVQVHLLGVRVGLGHTV